MQAPALPLDLVQAQRDWRATYRLLAEHPHKDTARLRRRLLQLSTYIWWHPAWAARPGTSPAARAHLRRLAARDGAAQ